VSDYFDALEAELRAAAGRAPARRGRSFGRFPLRLSAAALALAAAIPVVVAVMAVMLLGRDRSTDRPPPSNVVRPSTSAHPVPTLAQLKANFAVLRRPQTAADRSARLVCHRPCTERALPGLTRLARRLPDGSDVFFSVWRLGVAELGQAAGSYLLYVGVVGDQGAAVLTPDSLQETPFLAGPAGSYLVMPITENATVRAPMWIGIVPDGITSVRWTFACPRGAGGDRCRREGSLKPVSAEASVTDNVAAAQLAGTGSSIRVPTHADWYSGDGYQAASFASTQVLTRAPFLPRNLNPSPTHRPQSPNASGRARGRATRVAAVIIAHLSLFRRPLQGHPVATPPAWLRAVFNGPIGKATGGNLSLAREVSTQRGPVYVIPGNGTICQFGPGGGGCGPSAGLATDPDGYVIFGSRATDPSARSISGIVPDDVVAISAVLQTGRTVSVPVTSNVVSSEIPAKVTALRFRTNDMGTLSLSVPSTPAVPAVHTSR